MNPYPLQLELSGPIALWARPDTMPNPVSYGAGINVMDPSLVKLDFCP